jgi:hypothetical protein
MIKRALAAGIEAGYLLMDSWFASPSVLRELSRHFPVICMLKKMTKKGWLALATTHLNLAEEETTRLYGKRWGIEVFSKQPSICLTSNTRCRCGTMMRLSVIPPWSSAVSCP